MNISIIFTLSLINRILYTINIVLILIPLFFPLSLIICIIVNLLGLVIFYRIEYLEKFYSSKDNKKLILKLLENSKVNTKKAIRISIFTFLTSLTLYVFLNIHIFLCYRRSLNNEIEPLKEEYRKLNETNKY